MLTPKRLPNEREQDAGAASSWNAAKAQLPPVWVDRVDSVDEDVRQIQLKMRELSSLHTKRLMVFFDDASEQHKEREIEVMTQVTAPPQSPARQRPKKTAARGTAG